MQYASSASPTNGERRSGSAYTATVRQPSRRAVANTRLAISPRFATSSFTASNLPGYIR